MGVLTLLKHLQPCLEDSHVEAYRGKTVVVDGNTFIFRGCYSCSEKVATGQPCSAPVDYLLKRVNMLKHYGVKPWIVLDGRRTPMKDETNKQRREEREKNLRIALEIRKQADDSSGEKREALLQRAQSFFQKSIHVTRQMVTNAMAALKREGIRCMVAPYEADAQVAFLVKCGLAHAVITEDSDILVYMAAVRSTASVLYKMDEFGACKALGFDPSKISSLPGKIGKFGRGLSAFAGEGGGRMFVQLAALAGCDYVDNVRGLGLMSALPIVARFKSVPADCRVKRILMHLHKTGKTIPHGHRDRMLRAELSFFWHRVYDPRSRKCVHFCDSAPELVGTEEVPALSPLPGETDFLGEHIDDDMIQRTCRGVVDPATGEPVTAEPLATPAQGAVFRAMRQEGFSAPRRRQYTAHGAGAKSAIPRGTWNRDKGHGDKKVRPPPRGRGAGERVKESTKVPSGGLLKIMLERSRSRAPEKENAPLQDVSDVVLACAQERTSCCKQKQTPEASTPAAISNPFAKINAARNSPFRQNIFETPMVSGEGGGLDNRSSVAGRTGTDAWSRLSTISNCVTGESGGEGVVCDVDEETTGTNDIVGTAQRTEGSSRGTPSAGRPVVIMKKKRSLPTLTLEGRGKDRKKKAKPLPRSLGKGKTLLSYFGRSAD